MAKASRSYLCTTDVPTELQITAQLFLMEVNWRGKQEGPCVNNKESDAKDKELKVTLFQRRQTNGR